MAIQRYDIYAEEQYRDPVLVTYESDSGDWVKYEDYEEHILLFAELLPENKRLQKIIDIQKQLIEAHKKG